MVTRDMAKLVVKKFENQKKAEAFVKAEFVGSAWWNSGNVHHRAIEDINDNGGPKAVRDAIKKLKPHFRCYVSKSNMVILCVDEELHEI